jgi:hypothetical protein
MKQNTMILLIVLFLVFAFFLNRKYVREKKIMRIEEQIYDLKVTLNSLMVDRFICAKEKEKEILNRIDSVNAAIETLNVEANKLKEEKTVSININF